LALGLGLGGLAPLRALALLANRAAVTEDRALVVARVAARDLPRDGQRVTAALAGDPLAGLLVERLHRRLLRGRLGLRLLLLRLALPGEVRATGRRLHLR